MATNTTKLFFNNRLLSILSLGFLSGLPLALINATLQAWFTEAGVSLLAIGALSLIGLPYTLKFLWAPIMDHYTFSKLGKRKAWMLVMQAGLCIFLFILANMKPSTSASLMGIVALAIAFFSASQDISITAYQTDLLAPNERGLGVAYYVFAYRIALLFAGGIALVMADYIGFKVTYEIMAFLVACLMLVTYRAPAVTEMSPRTTRLFDTLSDAFVNLWQRENLLWLLLFIVFYKFGDALALSLMTNFLLKGLGFSLTEVGLTYKTVSFLATILGGLVGGIILSRSKLYSALLFFGLAQAFSNLMFVVLALAGKHFLLMVAAVFIENFCSGLSTAALLAFLMSLCDHRYTATQYAFFSAIASLGRVLLGPVAGLMVIHIGWPQFYFWSFVLSFPGILFLILTNKRVLVYEAIPCTK